MSEDEQLNMTRVAELLDSDRATVKYWIDKGWLKGEKIGRAWVINRSDLDAFVESRRSRWNVSDPPAVEPEDEAPVPDPEPGRLSTLNLKLYTK